MGKLSMFPNHSVWPCTLPVGSPPPAPRAWAPRSSAWSPPSPGVGRRPVGPDGGCCCGCGWPSAPPSFQRWGTWALGEEQQVTWVWHSSCRKQTHYTKSCLTWNYNKLYINVCPPKYIFKFPMNPSTQQQPSTTTFSHKIFMKTSGARFFSVNIWWYIYYYFDAFFMNVMYSGLN